MFKVNELIFNQILFTILFQRSASDGWFASAKCKNKNQIMLLIWIQIIIYKFIQFNARRARRRRKSGSNHA